MMVVRLEDLELLKLQHSEWDRLLREEEKHPYPDVQLIRSCKKHKLKIKEEIQKTEEELFKKT